MITISDVAKRAGVSIGTVSNVINKNGKVKKATAEIVLKAIDDLGYIPNTVAKSLKTSHTKIIGVLCEDVSAFSSGEIIDGICDYCEQNGYTITLCNLRVNRKVNHTVTFNYDELEASDSFQKDVLTNVNQLLATRVSGLIYIGVYPRDVKNVLPALDIPVVYTYAYTTNDDYCINYNDFQGAKLAVEFIIKNQHKDIAVISGSINSIPGHKRLLGYQTALMEHNLPFIPEYIRSGNWHYEDGYQQCQELLNLPKPPTAIFAMSDVMAYGAMNAAKDRGLHLPIDLSIHGFDDLELSSYTRPSLTTIGLPLKEMGLKSAESILKLICSEPLERFNILLDCSHCHRKSIAHINY